MIWTPSLFTSIEDPCLRFFHESFAFFLKFAIFVKTTRL